MIFIPYFCDFSIQDNVAKKAIKSLEMSRISYLYIRHFLSSNEHIYYADSASPISIDFLTSFLSEPYEILDEKNFRINFDVKIHIKKFNVLVDVERGVCRRIVDFLKIAWIHNQDYLAVDMDALVAYNIPKDFEGFDFGAQDIDFINRSISSYVTFISKNRLHNQDKYIELPSFLDYVYDKYGDNSKIMHLVLGGEGAYFRNFCYGKVNKMLYPEKGIHEKDKESLKNFILQNYFKHDYIDWFIDTINKNNNLL